jgi:hypothetical protein
LGSRNKRGSGFATGLGSGGVYSSRHFLQWLQVELHLISCCAISSLNILIIKKTIADGAKAILHVWFATGGTLSFHIDDFLANLHEVLCAQDAMPMLGDAAVFDLGEQQLCCFVE